MNEQALKARLKHIAKEQVKSFNEIWKLLVLERFLARILLMMTTFYALPF